MSRGGFTLLETLLTMLLLSMVLTVFASLVAGYTRVMRFVNSKDRALAGLHTGLSCAAHELTSAVAVASPNTAAPVGTLDFTRVDPVNPNRLPQAAPVAWDPLDAAFLIRVRYLLVGDTLMREQTPRTGTPQLQTVASGMTSFSVSLTRPDVVEIKATFATERQARNFTLRSVLRILR